MRNMLWSKVPTHEYIRDEAKQNLVVSERLKEKARKTTEVVGELELPLEPIVEEGEEDEVQNETNPHLQKGKKANVFNVKTYIQKRTFVAETAIWAKKNLQKIWPKNGLKSRKFGLKMA